MTQEFFIKEGSENPLLIMGSNETSHFKYEEYNNFLLKVDKITFSMYNMKNKCVLHKKTAQIGTLKYTDCEVIGELKKYYILFTFKNEYNIKKGRYYGEFTFYVDGNKTVLPIINQLFVNVN